MLTNQQAYNGGHPLQFRLDKGPPKGATEIESASVVQLQGSNSQGCRAQACYWWHRRCEPIISFD